MRPRIVQQGLKAARKWSPILYLHSSIVGVGVCLRQTEWAQEVCVRLIYPLLSEKISACLAHVGHGDCLFAPERFFEGNVPLVGARKLQVRRITRGSVGEGRLT